MGIPFLVFWCWCFGFFGFFCDFGAGRTLSAQLQTFSFLCEEVQVLQYLYYMLLKHLKFKLC